MKMCARQTTHALAQLRVKMDTLTSLAIVQIDIMGISVTVRFF